MRAAVPAAVVGFGDGLRPGRAGDFGAFPGQWTLAAGSGPG